MAEVTLEGWLAKPSELRFTQSGHPVLNFDIPDNHRKKQGDQWIEDGVTWYRVTYWGSGQNREDELAALSEQLTKGTRVMIRGDVRLTTREKDGKTYTNLDLTARRIGVVVQPTRTTGGGFNGGGGAPQQQGDPWSAQPPGGNTGGSWGGTGEQTPPF